MYSEGGQVGDWLPSLVSLSLEEKKQHNVSALIDASAVDKKNNKVLLQVPFQRIKCDTVSSQMPLCFIKHDKVSSGCPTSG